MTEPLGMLRAQYGLDAPINGVEKRLDILIGELHALRGMLGSLPSGIEAQITALTAELRTLRDELQKTCVPGELVELREPAPVKAKKRGGDV